MVGVGERRGEVVVVVTWSLRISRSTESLYQGKGPKGKTRAANVEMQPQREKAKGAEKSQRMTRRAGKRVGCCPIARALLSGILHAQTSSSPRIPQPQRVLTLGGPAFPTRQHLFLLCLLPTRRTHAQLR